MKKRYIYGIILGVVLVASAGAIAGNVLTERQKAEEEKRAWTEQHKNDKTPAVTYTPEQLEKMREDSKKEKEILDAGFEKEQAKADNIDRESEKILTRFYNKPIKILNYGEAEAQKAVRLIVDALHQSNDFSTSEIASLKGSLSRRYEALNNVPDLQKDVLKILGYDNITSDGTTPADVPPTIEQSPSVDVVPPTSESPIPSSGLLGPK